MQKKIIYTTFISFLSLVLVSCGSNTKEDPGNSGTYGTSGLSIMYISSEANGSTGFVDHYRVHAVDQNGDPISKLKVKVSIVNGVKAIGQSKLQVGKGLIESSTPIVFADNHVDFTQTSVKRGDNLIVVPTKGREDNIYLGNWTIESVGTKLTLREKAINLESTENLSYIIGGEKRYLGNNYRGRISIAHINVLNNITDTKGFSYFDIVYDTSLAAHTVTLGAYAEGARRLSVGKIQGLRGGEYSSKKVEIPVTGATVYVHMSLVVSGKGNGIEHIRELDVVPSSFEIEPVENCILNVQKSDLHTDGNGEVILAVDTNRGTDTDTDTASKKCTITWQGSPAAFYLEY